MDQLVESGLVVAQLLLETAVGGGERRRGGIQGHEHEAADHLELELRQTDPLHVETGHLLGSARELQASIGVVGPAVVRADDGGPVPEPCSSSLPRC